MTILWLAFGIYIIGVSLVLFLRPKLMFRPNGWKEFGLSSEAQYTIFPFWMFTLCWAVISYAIATLLNVGIATIALRSIEPESQGVSVPARVPKTNFIKPISSQYEVPTVIHTPPVPITPAAPAAHATPQAPGYYIYTPQVNGPAKYIYYGNTPPTENVLATIS